MECRPIAAGLKADIILSHPYAYDCVEGSTE